MASIVIFRGALTWRDFGADGVTRCSPICGTSWGDQSRSTWRRNRARRLPTRPSDLAASRADARMCWERIPTMGLQVSSVQDHSADIPDDGDIWLPRILGSDGHRNNQPFLILVHNFVRLLWAISIGPSYVYPMA